MDYLYSSGQLKKGVLSESFKESDSLNNNGREFQSGARGSVRKCPEPILDKLLSDEFFLFVSLLNV